MTSRWGTLAGVQHHQTSSLGAIAGTGILGSGLGGALNLFSNQIKKSNDGRQGKNNEQLAVAK